LFASKLEINVKAQSGLAGRVFDTMANIVAVHNMNTQAVQFRLCPVQQFTMKPINYNNVKECALVAVRQVT